MIERDPELAAKVRGADQATFATLAESLGVSCTMAELRSVLARPVDELSDDELSDVAGGLGVVRKYTSACGESSTRLTTCTKITTTTTPKGAVLFRG
jgi:hypothetical protein